MSELEELVEIKQMILDAARTGKSQVKIFTQLSAGNVRALQWTGYEVEETQYQTGDYKTIIKW